MKFELEPAHRNCPDETLLADLRRVAARLGRKTLNVREYQEKGRFNWTTLARRFGSWNQTLEKAGMEVENPKSIPVEELLADLKRVGSQLGQPFVSMADYHRHGRFSVSTFVNNMGSWRRALALCGLTDSPGYSEPATEDQLLANLGRLWEHLGRQPKCGDLDGPLSAYPSARYGRRFGSLRNALERFVASMNQAQAQDAATTTACATTTAPPGECFRHKTSRNISWRMKFLVMRRDHFKCRITGRAPATDPRVNLEVDHIIPWDKGGETVMDNLQTLCREINIGKSNLDMRLSETTRGEPSTGCKDANDG